MTDHEGLPLVSSLPIELFMTLVTTKKLSWKLNTLLDGGLAPELSHLLKEKKGSILICQQVYRDNWLMLASPGAVSPPLPITTLPQGY